MATGEPPLESEIVEDNAGTQHTRDEFVTILFLFLLFNNVRTGWVQYLWLSHLLDHYRLNIAHDLSSR